jgi:predicted methyltransferase
MNRQPACLEPRQRAASLLVICALLASCTAASIRTGGRETATALDNVLAAAHRSASAARDRYRHPKETLLFFGIRPDMTVVEIWPASGWYTEILAPFLRERGRLYAAHLDPVEGEYARAAVDRFKSWLAQRPDLYDRVTVTALGGPGSTQQIAPPGSADLVVTFRNLHNWMAFGWEREALQAAFVALKPGGVLGIVDHRAKAGAARDPKAVSGYVDEDYAIELIESVGFRLAGRSEINANSRDSKDYEAGVWTLPPSYARGDEDRAKYAAIGESDRFTLKFIKP